MIKEFFLPRRIKNYYLFATRIVAFDIGKTHIHATQIYVRGRSTTIEKFIELPIGTDMAIEHNERVSTAIKTIILQFDSYDYVYSSLPSSCAIFKEMKVPFTTHETIKKVVQYEVEPLLPFALHNATIDFIITKKNTEQVSSEIIVAAVQNQYIQTHLNLFADAGVILTVITLDMFALYQLYKKSSLHALNNPSVMLIDLGMHTTRIAYIQEGQLRFIRTIGKGISQQAKIIAERLNMQPNEIINYLMRYGLEKNSNQLYDATIAESFNIFYNEIQLTLQSFTGNMPQNLTTSLFILGQGSEIKGMEQFISNHLNTACQKLTVTDLLNGNVTIKTKTPLCSTSIMSVATALITLDTDQVNLRQGNFELSHDSLFNRQLFVLSSILLLLIGSLATYSYMQIRTLQKAAQSYEKEALDELKERPHFERILQEGLKGTKQKDQLEEAKQLVEQEVQRQEEMWFAFAGSARASKLKYLLELTTRIDKDALGFVIESLAFNDGTMTIKAQVKNHEALKLLEQSLDESPLFKPVPKQEETSFVMKINVSKNGQEN